MVMNMLLLKLRLAGLLRIAGAAGRFVANALATREMELDAVVAVDSPAAVAVATEEGNNDDILLDLTVPETMYETVCHLTEDKSDPSLAYVHCLLC